MSVDPIGTVAHYNLLEPIGEGGLGTVYRARDTKVGRTIALKLVPPSLVEGPRLDRLIADARAAARLSHPNVATLFEVGQSEGRLYLAYEYVQGQTIGRQLATSTMNSRHALDLAVQIADALAEGHAQGLLHNDIRPDSVVETPKGSAKLLEFGMWLWTAAGQTRALAAAAPDSLPRGVLPIVAYMSPEQALGGRVDPRSDLFSLGVLLYEMLTGTHPFAAESVSGTIVQITHRVPPPPTSLNPDLPRMVDVVLGRLLAKEVSSRTSSARKLASELARCRALMDDPGEPARVRPPARPASSPDLLPIEEERGGGLWWLLAALLAALAGLVYFWVR